MFKEYHQYDAVGLAKLLADGQVSPSEVLEAAIRRADAINPSLNALIHRFDDKARAACDTLPKGVFWGVPFVLKDLLYEYAGEPLSMGSRSVRIIPKADDEIVKRIKQSGLNSFAKTNTPEFGLTITTEPKAFGATHNPFKQGYSAGGSSGGSAAAVASGIVPMATGGDGGGSIRFPAAWCGVFGLKPTRGRTPILSSLDEDWFGAVVNHVITRSVRDSAMMLDVLSGAQIGSPFILPSDSFYQASQTPPKPLKIAFHQTPLIANTVIDKDVSKALTDTAQQLGNLGHHVEAIELPVDITDVWRDFLVVVGVHTAFLIDELGKMYGAKTVSQLEAQTLNLAMLGRSVSAVDLLMAKRGWQRVRYQTDKLLQSYDVILSPTVPTPAVPLGALTPKPIDEFMMGLSNSFKIGKLLLKSGIVEKLSHPIQSKMAFTLLANITGMPAASVPVGLSTDGLPIGMQILAKLNDEATLISLAAQMEAAGLFIQPPVVSCGIEHGK